MLKKHFMLFLLIIFYCYSTEAVWCKCNAKFINANTNSAKSTTNKCCEDAGLQSLGAWWTRFCDVGDKYSIKECCEKNGYDYGCR